MTWVGNRDSVTIFRFSGNAFPFIDDFCYLSNLRPYQRDCSKCCQVQSRLMSTLLYNCALPSFLLAAVGMYTLSTGLFESDSFCLPPTL